MTKLLDKTLPVILDFENPKMVATLKATVAQNATDEEFQLFAELCKATGLNPFKREVWFIKGKSYTNKQGERVEGKLQVMTGINGYLAIANRHSQFDGMETEVIRDPKTNKPLKAICKVYRKDRRVPHTAEAYFDEYYQSTYSGKPGIWDQKPSIMIAKVAKSIALREAFPQELNGLYTEEEMPENYGKDAIDVTPQKAKAPELPPSVEKDQLPGDEPAMHRYDLNNYAAEKGDKWPKIATLMLAKGCRREVEGTEIWVSAAPLEKLSQYEIVNDTDEEEAA